MEGSKKLSGHPVQSRQKDGQRLLFDFDDTSPNLVDRNSIFDFCSSATSP
jgi:hypothetical protein